MHVYAVIGYLDNETEIKFKNLWKILSDRGITNYGIETKGKRPHITIADYDILDKDKFISLFDKYYSNKDKINLSLNILGTFINTSTLFIAPTLSTELITFHKNHHNFFMEFNKDESSFYLPGKWVPHCTIASRLNEDNMVDAFKFCKSYLNKTLSQLSEIALIEIKLNEKGVAIDDTIIFSKNLN